MTTTTTTTTTTAARILILLLGLLGLVCGRGEDVPETADGAGGVVEHGHGVHGLLGPVPPPRQRDELLDVQIYTLPCL